jgi:hypothetical protein
MARSKLTYFVAKEVTALESKLEAKKFLQNNQKSGEKLLLIRGKECSVIKETKTKITIK